jgi:hypothetical protein
VSAGSPGPVREKQLQTPSANMLALKRETPRSCAHTRSVKHAPHASALQSHDKASCHNASPNRGPLQCQLRFPKRVPARSGDSNFTWADESLSCAMALLASAHAGASRRSAAAWSVSANPLGADILRCKGQASLQKAAKQADPVFPCLRLSLCRTSWHQFCRSTSRPTW